MEGLLSLHAFSERSRFVKGGAPSLPVEFWRVNNDDAEKVRKTPKYWLHAGGDFVARLHDILYDNPINWDSSAPRALWNSSEPSYQTSTHRLTGESSKALGYLGFNVRPA
jgi:hypothetical protein